MRSSNIGFRIAICALFAYWLILFISTHIPGRHLPHFRISDKWLHGGAFLVLSFLLACAIPTDRSRPFLNVLVAFAIAVGYAVIDELTQIPVGRTADWRDFLADIVGASLGLTIYLIMRKIAQTFDPDYYDESHLYNEEYVYNDPEAPKDERR